MMTFLCIYLYNVYCYYSDLFQSFLVFLNIIFEI